MEPIYTWNEETKTATCEFTSRDGKKFIGTAKCHPDDYDFGNKLAGQRIACGRLVISTLKEAKSSIKIGLAALKQLYYSMNQSRKFNPKSYENRMLQRQIRLAEDDIKEIEALIQTEKDALKNYIEAKDELYKNLRAKRAKADNQSN